MTIEILKKANKISVKIEQFAEQIKEVEKIPGEEFLCKVKICPTVNAIIKEIVLCDLRKTLKGLEAEFAALGSEVSAE